MVTWQIREQATAVVAGVRTPLAKMGTALRHVHVAELAAAAMREVLYRADWPAGRVDQAIMGNVVMPADATNPARVAALYAGLPADVPALTVQRNCGSGMEAIAHATAAINAGESQVVLAGGMESMSTIPLLFPDETLDPMGRLAAAKSIGQRLKAIASLRPRHFKPRSALIEGLTDPTCGMIMGKTAEVLAHEFGVTRREQDEFALRSHQSACAAMEQRLFDEQIVPVYAGDRFTPVTRDIGPREGQTLEALAKLKPIFDKRDGSVTVGNACQVTDGAAAVLMMHRAVAAAEGLEPLGYVKAYAVAGLDPKRMGLGPVFAIDKLLTKTGMTMRDVGLWEINEAFAAQVLACVKAMGSDRFAQQHLGRGGAIGELDMDKLNVAGGAIALGHPVGATGARIVLNLLRQMRRRNVEIGVAALCIGGGQGAAMMLQLN